MTSGNPGDIIHYRVQHSQSFFDSVPQWMEVPDSTVSKCSCNSETSECSIQANVIDLGTAPSNLNGKVRVLNLILWFV